MRSRHNPFGNPGANRNTIRRSDDAWVDAQRERPETRFVIGSGQQLLADGQQRLARLTAGALPAGWREWQRVYLGEVEQTPLFALDAPDNAHDAFGGRGQFMDPRPLALQLDHIDAALAAHARAVLHWHSLNRHCGTCGGMLMSASGGHARRCANVECTSREIFPRIDPAVIVLVTHEDRCLLGRQAAWPAGRYSCLAGFAEAGETLEETVRREVFEEAGVAVADIEYHSSQPWPFPQSLMIGFRARATSPAIALHDDELEDARWFTREDLRRDIVQGALKPPSRLSIAFHLLRDWYAQDADPSHLGVER